ncbi:KTSC domain-containing protein [Actinokineospora sp.]|uniref:KTSC domain-containing protein n=1 Tax=Actinokineospora sp. TaxID=1872133 RepID=UPI004037DC62
MESASIASVGYDGMTGTLEVEFRNGGVYQYIDVPKRLYWRLMSADSLGAFLNLEIKDRHETRKVR